MDKNSKKNSTATASQQAAQKVEDPNDVKLDKKKPIHISKKTRIILLSIVYGVLDVVTALTAISVMVLSTVAALAVKIYMNQNQGYRVAGLIGICITGAVTIAACIYGLTALCKKKKKNKHLHIVSVMFLVLATLQLIITGTSLLVDQTDLAELNESLRHSFQNFEDFKSLDHKKWTLTEHNLKCCGLNSPADHKYWGNVSYIPVSCCPAFDPNKPEYMQVKVLQHCINNNLYYKIGCKEKLDEGLVNAAAAEIHIVISIVILELLTCAAGVVVAKISKSRLHDDGNHDV